MVSIFPLLNEEEQALYACLALQHRVGYAGFARLLESLGSPRAVYETPAEKLRAIHPKLSDETLDSIGKGPNLASWDEIHKRCRKLGVLIAVPGTADYPQPLLDLN